MSVNEWNPSHFHAFLREGARNPHSFFAHTPRSMQQAQGELPRVSSEQRVAAGTSLQMSQQIDPGAHTRQLWWNSYDNFDTDTMLEDPASINALYGTVNQYDTMPMLNNPTPSSYAFRPMLPGEQLLTATVPRSIEASIVPSKFETTPLLPTPTVTSQYVDASKYEALTMDAWVTAAADYEATSPFSEHTAGSSPLFPSSEEGDSFVDYLAQRSTYGGENLLVGMPSAPHSSTYSYFPNPFGEANSAGSGPVLNGYMLADPPTIPPFRYKNPHHGCEAASASLRDIERPTSSLSDSADSLASTSQLHHQSNENVNERHDRDQLLLDLRNKNMSYREIKRVGEFPEAESTLRGRVRMLTKDKSERVRKPQWTQGDVTLLRNAVAHFARHCSPSQRRALRKVPWKKASQWMKDHGSSYTFAPATCARKWEEINRQRRTLAINR